MFNRLKNSGEWWSSNAQDATKKYTVYYHGALTNQKDSHTGIREFEHWAQNKMTQNDYLIIKIIADSFSVDWLII